MSDVSGVPNLGIPGLSGFVGGAPNNSNFFANPSSGLDSAYAQQAANTRFFGNQSNTLAAAQVPQSQLYAGGSFGAQPAYYAGVGAAYGRAVSPSSPAAIAAQSPQAPASVFDTGASAVPYPDSLPPGSFSPSPNYPGRTGGPIPPQQPQTVPGTGGPTPGWNPEGGTSSHPQNVQPPAMGSVFDPGTYAPANNFRGRFSAAPPITPGLQPNLQPELPTYIQSGVGNTTPQAPGFSSASFSDRFGAAPASDPGSFASRFAPAMQGNPGTPSQYYTGTQYPNAQQPPSGYQTLFSADNPGGALPVGGFRR